MTCGFVTLIMRKWDLFSALLEEPKWPDKTFRELLRIAFEGRIIDRPDHPLIRELNGDL